MRNETIPSGVTGNWRQYYDKDHRNHCADANKNILQRAFGSYRRHPWLGDHHCCGPCASRHIA